MNKWLRVIAVIVITTLIVPFGALYQPQEVSAAGGIEQLIISSVYSLNKTTDMYFAVQGGYVSKSAISSGEQVISTSGIFSTLAVELSGVPGTNPYRITLVKNGVPTALYVDIVADGTQSINSTDTVLVVAGDTVCLLSSRPSGNPDNTPRCTTSIMFTSDNDNESLILGVFYPNSTSALRYAPLSCGYSDSGGVSAQATESYVYQIIPTNGTIKNIYVQMLNAPGVGKSFKYTLRVNGASKTLECTVADANTTANDVANSVAVNAGDKVDLMITPSGTPTLSNTTVGYTFVSDTTDEFIILGGYKATLDNANTKYNAVNTIFTGNPWDATESVVSQNGSNGFVFSDLYMYLSAAPGAGKAFTFDIRADAVNTGIQVVVADGNQTGSDTTNIYKLDGNYNSLSISSTPSNTPTAGYAHWGLVGLYNPISVPTLTTSAATSVTYNSATGNGNITDTGGENASVRGFCYSSVTNPPTTADDTVNSAGSFGAGAYSLDIPNLDYGTTYYLRSYATNTAGTGYGSTVTFTTPTPGSYTILKTLLPVIVGLGIILAGISLWRGNLTVAGFSVAGAIVLYILISALLNVF